jgi:hypothetical protein
MTSLPSLYSLLLIPSGDCQRVILGFEDVCLTVNEPWTYHNCSRHGYISENMLLDMVIPYFDLFVRVVRYHQRNQFNI